MNRTMEIFKKVLMIFIIIVLILCIIGGILYILYGDDIIAIGNEKENSSNNSYEKFNSEFTNYSGMQRGPTVRTLINVIKENNGKNEKHQITVEYENKEHNTDDELTNLNKDIKSSELYEIEILKDENNYINKIKINKNPV